MSWFQVDDGFYSHPKVLLIPRAVRAEAIGTWTLCGTWSADKLSDGKIPAYMVDELGGTIAGADALVTVKLWRKNRTGYVFVNWSEFQRTREEVLKNREAERKRKADQRAKNGAGSASVPVGQIPDSDPPILFPTLPTEEDLRDRPTSSSGEGQDDGLSTVVRAVVDNVAKHCQRQIHPLVVPDVIGWIDARRGKAEPPRYPARYYGSTIAREWAELQQFIDTKGLAA